MKDKIKKINEKYNIFFIISIIVFIMFYSNIIAIKVECGDEIWNFANCYKMYEGYKIYKEINIIVTPLFCIIAQLFFRVFGATLFTFRIYNIVIFIAIFGLISKIFKNLKIEMSKRNIYILLMFFTLITTITAGANYNILVFIPILVYLLLLVKNKEDNFITGILLFLTFLIKQNIFVYFALGILGCEIIKERKIKYKIISLFKIYLVALIGVLAFGWMLYLDGNLYNFINLCFLGISEFADNNLAIVFWDIKLVYISIIIIIAELLIVTKYKHNMNKDVIYNIKKFLCLEIPLMATVLPIVNSYHTTLASICTIIGRVLFNK